LLDNAFVQFDDFSAAQRIADNFSVRDLHRSLDRFARRYCPVARQFGVAYHWSLMQVEYATDIVFRRQQDLTPLYETITGSAPRFGESRAGRSIQSPSVRGRAHSHLALLAQSSPPPRSGGHPPPG